MAESLMSFPLSFAYMSFSFPALSSTSLVMIATRCHTASCTSVTSLDYTKHLPYLTPPASSFLPQLMRVSPPTTPADHHRTSKCAFPPSRYHLSCWPFLSTCYPQPDPATATSTLRFYCSILIEFYSII